MERVINLELMMESVYRDLIGLQSAIVLQYRGSSHIQNNFFIQRTEFFSKDKYSDYNTNFFDMTVISNPRITM